MPNAQWVTLESVIFDYINEAEQSDHKYYRLWHLAFRGMEELGLQFFYEIKSIPLVVSGTKTAELPNDFLNYSKIGYLNSNGELIAFTQNSKLSLSGSLSPNRLTNINSNNTYGSDFGLYPNTFYNYFYNGAFCNIYGLPSGTYKPSFRIDRNNHLIVFEPNFNYNNVVLEYTASPQDNEAYYVPMIFRETLIAWLAWKDINSAPAKRAIVDDRAAKKHDFYNQKRVAQAKFNPVSLIDAYEWNLKSQRLTVKV